MHMKMVAIPLATLLAAVSINSWSAVAQDTYPSRPVRIVVSLPPGSAPDIRARIIANSKSGCPATETVLKQRRGSNE